MGESFNYTNVEFTRNEDYSNFPIIVLNNENNIKSYCIIHRFKTNGKLDYTVIGKVYAESLIESIRDYKEFVALLSKYLSSSDKRVRNELFEEIKSSNFFKQILFTQEGYDLLIGKHFYTNGEIQKTVLTKTYVEDEELVFDSTSIVEETNKVTGLKNENGITTEIETFDSFDKYDEHYFVNPTEFKKMDKCDAALYVRDNYSKIISYINNNYPSFYKNASNIDSFELPEEKLAYMAQILDVLYDAQFGEKYSRHI